MVPSGSDLFSIWWWWSSHLLGLSVFEPESCLRLEGVLIFRHMCLIHSGCGDELLSNSICP